MKLLGQWLLSGVMFICCAACEDEITTAQINGTLFKDCNSAFASAEIALKVNPVGSSINEPIILGSTRTNASGQFQISYELEDSEIGSADLIYLQPAGFETLIEGIPLKQDEDLTLYFENVTELVVQLSGSRNWQAQDTLFVGITINDYETEYTSLVNGVLDTLKVQIPNTLSEVVATDLYYGIGTQDFIRSKEALQLQDSVYQNIQLTLEGCAQIEQMELQIN